MAENPVADFIWTGRDDGSGPDFDRYYRRIQATAAAADFTLIGFACDEGVRRNQGAAGAANGPRAIRTALANLVPHHQKSIHDAGDIHCTDGQLTEAQSALADAVATALAQESTPIVLGGGHEVAYGSFSGLLQEQQRRGGADRIGIINFDAHFDLRADDLPSSGTPFLQAAKASRQAGVDFRYLVLGIAEHSNTPALFATAAELSVGYVVDRELRSTPENFLATRKKIDAFLQDIDALYLSLDMDVFPAAVAPGVSAPAARGVAVHVVEELLHHILDSGKVRVFDVAETNPVLDPDQHTARLAALMIHEAISRHRRDERRSAELAAQCGE